jgi:hypothetical protein
MQTVRIIGVADAIGSIVDVITVVAGTVVVVVVVAEHSRV